MYQTRFHGRGGQGVVTAAEMLSKAAFSEGKFGQAFPSFGSERMGAPVMSFCRIDDKVIRLREPIEEPDALIVQDPTLIASRSIFEGLRDDGYIVLNSAHPLETLGINDIIAKLPKGHVVAFPATEIALQHIKRPLPNTIMLAGFVALTGKIRLESVLNVIRETFAGAVGEANIAAAKAAFDIVSAQQKELAA